MVQRQRDGDEREEEHVRLRVKIRLGRRKVSMKEELIDDAEDGDGDEPQELLREVLAKGADDEEHLRRAQREVHEVLGGAGLAGAEVISGVARREDRERREDSRKNQ